MPVYDLVERGVLMSDFDGQLTITDYLKSQIKIKNVMDLTAFINSQGNAQYKQIEDIVSKTYEQNKDSDDVIGRITNAVSVYVLDMSMKYMNYLRKESEV